jgi:sugar phosphate isomerase/epimerase
MFTRRTFGKIALAGLPLSLALRAETGVSLGASTNSFRDFPRTPGQDNVDDVIQALKSCGVKQIELASANVEPAGPNSGPAAPPKPSVYPAPVRELSPEEIAAAKLAVRNSLRRWRLSTPAAQFEAFRGKFEGAGIAIAAYAIDYDAEFTDDEIAATFHQAKALGADVITTSSGFSAAHRLAPFAEKNGVLVALRNSAQVKDPDALSNPEALAKALAISSSFRVNLDLGNLTAANCEAVAYLQENHARIVQVRITDRTRNGGGNEKFGDGDAPIKPVLALLKEKQWPIRAIVDYEYVGLGTPIEELKRCMAYAKAALA